LIIYRRAPLTEIIDLSAPESRGITALAFQTYAFYLDRPSRRAAQRILRNVVPGRYAAEILLPLVDALRGEVAKSSVAPGNSFVLTEWCCVLIEQLTKVPELWSKWGLPTIEALAITLERLM